MSVVRRLVKGEKRWVIDRVFRAPDGKTERYRRVAQVQSKAAAEAEERRLCDHWAEHGTIAAILRPQGGAKSRGRWVPEVQVETPEPPIKVATWEDAVEIYKADVLPMRKNSTQIGYRTMLGDEGMAYWAGKPLSEINYRTVSAWDLEMAKSWSPGTRRNHHIILRSVLRSVCPIGDSPGLLLTAMPKLPSPPRVGRSAVQSADDEILAKLLGDTATDPAQAKALADLQVAIALAAYAGLRAGEVRALRRKDIDLETGILTVRASEYAGVETSPKSGHYRTVPLHSKLRERLEPVLKKLKPNALVSLNNGKSWGTIGLTAAFVRICKRLGIKDQHYHGLRHYFASSLFGGGADAVTVQHLLGHSNLSTTQRYSHHSEERARAAMAKAFNEKPKS